MKSWERLCLIAARSEALLMDFMLLFVVRMILKYAGLDYVYFQPVLGDVSPPFALADILQHPVSAIFYGSTFFVSGLPNLIFAGMWLMYAIVALSIFGKTVGMRVTGIALVDNRWRKPGLHRVIVRQIVAPISSICWIGYWFVIWTPHASALHDLASGTRIVSVQRGAATED